MLAFYDSARLGKPSKKRTHERRHLRAHREIHLRHLARPARMEAAPRHQGGGRYFWDAAGKRYLDLSAQLICSNLGHQNQAVIDAICAQARELAFISPAHTCDVRAKLSLKLLEVHARQGLDKFFFTTSGTEANEAAIKIARMYTGKHKIIARYTLVPRLDRRLDRRDGRFAPLVRRAGGQDPGRHLRARGQLLPLPAPRRPTPSAASPAPTTSRT